MCSVWRNWLSSGGDSRGSGSAIGSSRWTGRVLFGSTPHASSPEHGATTIVRMHGDREERDRITAESKSSAYAYRRSSD